MTVVAVGTVLVVVTVVAVMTVVGFVLDTNPQDLPPLSSNCTKLVLHKIWV